MPNDFTRPSQQPRTTPGGWLRSWCLLVCVYSVAIGGGCATQRFLIHRDVPANPLNAQLELLTRSGPKITSRTDSVLRRYALSDLYETEPRRCLEEMQSLLESETEGELVYGVSELAYILGKRQEKNHHEPEALDLYAIAVSNAYMYLFSNEFDVVRNPYDPQFRGACDLYNESLEATLRLINRDGHLKPGYSYQLTTGTQTYEVPVQVRGKWGNADFERFEFVSDYELEGLPASGLTYGLGVPLIAVRKKGDPSDPREQYYPDGLSFPVTALLRVVKPGSMPGSGAVRRHHCVLELHDPLDAVDLSLAGRLVPLQTDLSTSLAYFLDSDQFRETDQATLGLIDPQRSQKHRGIFMLEPFDPKRIPVVMVHGLWSSPVTWMPMFNDLRSFAKIRENYQFWFYQYPTGQPFWSSATQMREDLTALRQQLDPDHRYQALDYTVLVGHSMGGLVSRMQTIDSGDQFWQIMSEEPFEKINGNPEALAKLHKAAYFKASHDIKRVVTIGTPHRGSDYANDTTRWLGRKLIRLPTMMVATTQDLVNQNPGVFLNADLLINSTSIDSLSPESPVFPVMLRAPRPDWVTYHNIIGLNPTRSWLGTEKEATGDGVVEYGSAHMDDVVSEITVKSEHQNIHRHPQAILEVRRILLEHLDSVQAEYRVAQRLAQLEAQRASEPVLAASSERRAATPGLPPLADPRPRAAVVQATYAQE
ncbi:esterase/lipase family protein [Aureliella helgolandensis]|uniref:Alpha/beta hydrolase family protein n=1 Tax=Aureliella helgolandensis TaxID=2527968 RepID=A0A518FZQ4_9BACT|nr:alpha/beta fold hydrolase [Aureliella helgolandensis]QDV21744.1 Alpha/beta hydrolase family protein [Aureliella helgolandensis]